MKMSKVTPKEAPKSVKPKTKNIWLYSKGSEKVTEETKLAPQAKIIVSCVRANSGLNHDELIAACEKAGIETRQPVTRIIGYYRKDLQDGGFINVQKKQVELAA
jgi:type IV secretory pathway VirD2 relaxase